MAERLCSPKTGAVAIPGSFGVFQSFDVAESQALEEVTAFGTDVFGAFRGNGTPTQSVTATGFLKTGAASTNPGFGTSGANVDQDGGSATLTFETSTTLTGSYIVQEIRASVSRIRGAESCTWTLRNAGDITATWASS